jgi:type II secretory pathway pseudopilin PulG
MKSRKGQIWVETVLYTLIGLALIGIVLAIVTPRINNSRDRVIVEQTIGSLGIFDESINEALDKGPGNIRRITEFSIRRGSLFIDGQNDQIYFVIEDLNKPYSEPGINVKDGRITILSEEGQKDSTVTLTLDYSGRADIRHKGNDAEGKYSIASAPYAFSIENNDLNAGGVYIINIVETTGR